MSDIHKRLKKQFAPLYLLYGTEAFFINETIKLITTEALEEEDREFNVVTYDLEEAYLEDVVEDARTLPFFGERKVLLIKSPLFLTSQRKVRTKYKILEEYIGNLLHFLFLFLLRLTKSLMNEKNYKTIKENSRYSRSECDASAGCSKVDCSSCRGRACTY